MPDVTATPHPIKFSWVAYSVLGLGLFAVIAYDSVLINKHSSNYDEQRATERYATLAKIKADEDKALTTVAWVDQAKGTVQIPIDEAVAKEIDTLKAKPVQMGSAIPGAAPATPATPVAPTVTSPAATTNAPAAAPMKTPIPAAPTPPPAAKTNP